MNKKIRFAIALFILMSAFSGGAKANAGLFDWVSQDTDTNYLDSSDWTVVNMLKGLQLTKEEEKQDEQVEKEIIQQATAKPVKKQTAKVAETKKIMVVVATAYSSTPDQTDDTPFITAKGTQVRDGIIAANFLPFGTQIRIPEIFGNKVFVVEDRMNKRYWYRVDIWFPERQMAKEFGIKKVVIEII